MHPINTREYTDKLVTMSPVDVSDEVADPSAKPNMLEASDLSVNLVDGQDIEDKIIDVSDDAGKGRDGGQNRDVGAGIDHTYSNLGILALSELLGGMTYSLLSPFYTKEATRKGCSVTETGIVSTASIRQSGAFRICGIIHMGFFRTIIRQRLYE